MNNVLEIVWKWWWPYLRLYVSRYLYRELIKTTKTLRIGGVEI